MRAGATHPYEEALATEQSLDLVASDGRLLPLPIQRYLREADEVDSTVLERCVAPVLDVGCGPGRMVRALTAAGQPALGIDIAATAVALALNRGAPALLRDAFGQLPGEGRWPTILLLDGNIGIGGNIELLLQRLTRLLAPNGSLIVEASTTGSGVDEALQVRFSQSGQAVGPEFGWAIASAEVVITRSEHAGMGTTDYWSAGGRDFLRLTPRTAIR